MREESLLSTEVYDKLQTMKTEAANRGLEFGKHWILTCTGRYADEQVVLYLKGRTSLSLQNEIRSHMKGRMSPITQAENNVVTWVIYESKHIIIPGIRDRCEAFDIVVVKAGKATWDLKESVDGDSIPDYTELVQAGQAAGLESGSEWKKKDWPHFQKRG